MNENAEGGAERGNQQPLTLRPVLWLAGIIVLALGGVLTNAVAEQVGDAINSATNPRPISVDKAKTYGVTGAVLGSGATPSAKELEEELNHQRRDARMMWLVEEHGGVPVGSVSALVVVRGQRSSPVQIVDIAVDRQCEPPLRGALFAPPPFTDPSLQDSQRLTLDLDDPNALLVNAKFDSDDGQQHPLPAFPGTTISLNQDERQVILVKASTTTSHCRFWLVMTVLDGAAESTVTIPSEGVQPFQVTAAVDFANYHDVYSCGDECSRVVINRQTTSSWGRTGTIGSFVS